MSFSALNINIGSLTSSSAPGLMYQTSDIDGEWAHNPEFFGDLKTGKLWDSFAEDEWYQATLTVEGSIGDIDVIYAGAYLNLGILFDIYLQDLVKALQEYEKYQSLTQQEDSQVAGWIVDIQRRIKPTTTNSQG